MRIKALIIILIALVTLITAIVGVRQPVLHKQTMFSDEYHRFVEEDIPTSDISISQVQSAPAQPQQPQVKQTKPPVKIIQQIIQVPVETPPQKKVEPQVKKVEPQAKPAVKPTTQTASAAQTTQKPHELTEQEEIIAWNRWRSNLQNQVMKDAPTRAPLGTVFKFSFTVDKYGNMSNIKVWSENPHYTDLAVRVIKPVLSSYTHKPILNFPKGTKRVITNVTGGYVISTRTKYSSPSDYSDYEKVKRYH